MADDDGYVQYSAVPTSEGDSQDTFWGSEATNGRAPGAGHGRQRKKTRIMRWLILHSSGEKRWLTMDKRQVIKAFGLDIPSRDMRLMDTHLVNYDTIGRLLVRDNALVISMEHVRMIIMADKVILPLEDADKGDLRERFHIFLEHLLHERGSASHRLEKLQQKLNDPSIRRCFSFAGDAVQAHQAAAKSPAGPPHPPPGLPRPKSYMGKLNNLGSNEREQCTEQGSVREQCTVQGQQPGQHRAGATPGGSSAPRRSDGGDVRLHMLDDNGEVLPEVEEEEEEEGEEDLPFELRVLEAALGEICNHLAQEVEVLQSHAGPAVEMITRKTDRETLERVRRIKSKRQRLVTRVGLIREILEELTEDDGDMWRMCLNRQQQLQESRKVATAARADSGWNSGGPTGLDEEDVHDLLDVENLLESYFMLVDSTYQTLLNLGEYIEDTEDLINIQLDSSRNRLIRFEILLAAGTFGLAIFAAVSAALGENLVLPTAITKDLWGFAIVNGITLLICFSIVAAIFSMLRSRKLI